MDRVPKDGVGARWFSWLCSQRPRQIKLKLQFRKFNKLQNASCTDNFPNKILFKWRNKHSNIFQLRPIMKTFVDAAWKIGRKKRSLNGPKNTKIIDCIIYVASVNAVGKCDAYFVESLKPSRKAAKIHLFTFQTWRHFWKVRHEILFNWIQVFVHFRNNWTNGVVISKRNWLNGKFVVMFLGIPPRYTLECG